MAHQRLSRVQVVSTTVKTDGGFGVFNVSDVSNAAFDRLDFGFHPFGHGAGDSVVAEADDTDPAVEP